ncbi:MAG TPA: esterase-like activity of phytase family protein, partial [Alphaproteobacteria bacterium]|nr:esterase-like activity of phytase family protein [Alphaproteobacteria bacterium]
AIGMIDISDPANPKPLGSIEMGGEPTSVAVIGTRAYIGVNTSKSYTAPSGHLSVIDLPSKQASKCELGGQPDSVAAAKDGSFVAIAIENERDEDLNKGALPQMPAGMLVTVPVKNGVLDCDAKVVTDLTGLAEIGASDPEPEFVDVNSRGEIVVTLQENNHIAVVDRRGKVLRHFSAGSVDLTGIDVDEEGALTFTGEQRGRLREPDGVKWLDDDHFVTANEGDYNGGSRGFTIFRKDGTVVYEDYNNFEKAIIQIGHYPEKRSGNKGAEPEAVETATFGGQKMIFIGAERSSVVGVYMVGVGKPTLKQLLPSGIGPEGILAIPARNLLVTANEGDLIKGGGPRAHVMIYQLQDRPAAYPSITSAGATELIGWGALSGLVADPTRPARFYAVNDSFYRSQPSIFEIDASKMPARIIRRIPITRDGMPAQKLDLEGITTDGAGGFWLASEGRTDRLVPHALYHVNAKGEIKQEISFPAKLLAGEKRFGAEGVTRIGDTLWIAIQREWKDDPKNHVKLLAYNIKTKKWGAVLYPKAQPKTGWVGLSEITAHGDYVYIIERDNQIGNAAVTKKLYRVKVSELKPAALTGDFPTVSKEEVRD